MAVLTESPEKVSWRGLDFSRLSSRRRDGFLQSFEDRAESRLVPFTPITPEERLREFEKLGFHPHGLFLPDDEDQRRELLVRAREIGTIENISVRQRRYLELQAECEGWQKIGVEGHWNGQQALARSRARFRIAAQGRRAGKTTEAAMECIAVANARPRSWCWLVGPTMKLADRAFEKVKNLVLDLGIDARINDSGQNKVIFLPNQSKIEAISAENVWSMAGAAIDFAVIDEAAQIVPETWTRGVLPPLTDRNGQALLISSWEGEGDFFEKKAIEAEAEMSRTGEQSNWELFKDASYDVNFYVFPQGEQTPALLAAAKEMDPIEYLEQFGAIPATSRDRVFPEFKDRVHISEQDYNDKLPVVLVADPSGGANPYCVLAIQDYGDHIVIFDEFYEAHRSTEEIAPILADRWWFKGRKVSADGEPDRWEIDNIKDMIIDGTQPETARMWIRMGFPAYACPEQPQVPDRIPLMKNWLRDPTRYRPFWLSRRDSMLADMGKSTNDLMMLSREDLNALVIRVEESLADGDRMTKETTLRLRECSRVRVNRRCTNLIAEYKAYAFPKKRRLNMNYKEVPRDWMNHAMDCYGYYLWTKKRFEGEFSSGEAYDYLTIEVLPEDEDDLEEERNPSDRREGRNPFLAPESTGFDEEARSHMLTLDMRWRSLQPQNRQQTYVELV